jgi:flavin-dependent dehydrogenase
VKPITIIGGGLAGLSLGIRLRREKIPVTLYEASHYPRHRVCGEFLSGAGREIFSTLSNHTGLDAREASFFLNGRPASHLTLPEPALCLSRYEMDSALAREFQFLGGILHQSQRAPAATSGEATVHATGRRRADSARGHLIGLKAHATNAPLSADLELHFAPNRYVGICRLAENRVNVCGLFFSREPFPNLQQTWPAILSNSIPALASATWLAETFCAVAAITLAPHRNPTEFSIGDAAAMIPPLTGNGMSMAFESAALAAPPLISYSRASLPWSDALAQYHSAWDRQFARRLRWANFSQRLLFNPHSQRLLFATARIFPGLPQLLFAKTR